MKEAIYYISADLTYHATFVAIEAVKSMNWDIMFIFN